MSDVPHRRTSTDTEAGKAYLCGTVRLVGKKVRVGKITIKQKCCVSKKRCSSCPIRLLAEGRMPEGYTVHKRKLVTVSAKKAKKAKAAARRLDAA